MSNIEYLDEVRNLQGWGCYGPGGTPDKPLPCFYCYSEGFSKRNFSKCPACRTFRPHWHPESLTKPFKKSTKRVGVCFMSDLLHPETPRWQIEAAIEMTQNNPDKQMFFLTKNPARYKEFNWPDNCWLGTTVTNNDDMERGDILDLGHYEVNKTWLSMEPLLEPVGRVAIADWIVIGLETKNGKTVSPAPLDRFQLADILNYYEFNDRPVYMKDSLISIVGAEKIIKELPG